MLRLKKPSNFPFCFKPKIGGCVQCVQTALFASWNNFDFWCFFWLAILISCILYNHCSICILKFAGVTLYRLWTQTEDNTVVSTTAVQGLNRAAPATFRMQIEQIWTNFEQPQIRLRKNGKFEHFLSLSLRNVNACFKLKKYF